MPPTPPEILCLARQAGTATAFGPLVDALERGGVGVRLAALGAAAKAWSERRPLTGGCFEDLVDSLDSGPSPRVLITGTSADPEDDARSWEWARTRQIPTVAFVDSWVNYAERFTAAGGGWVAPLPDNIGCVDELAARRLKEAGLPADRVLVLGNPAFDGLASRVTPAPPRPGLVVLFASQPLAGRGFPAPWDEHRALDMLLEALAAANLGSVTVRVRLHPAEAPDKFADLAARPSPVRVVIDTEPDRIRSVSSSHLVVGVATMLQVEARWLGRPAVSLQAGGHVPSDLIDGQGIRVYQDAASFTEALLGDLTKTPRATTPPPPSIPRWRAMLDALPA